MTSKFTAFSNHVPRIAQVSTIQVQRWTEERESQFVKVCVRFISIDWNKLLPYIFKEPFSY